MNTLKQIHVQEKTRDRLKLQAVKEKKTYDELLSEMLDERKVVAQ